MFSTFVWTAFVQYTFLSATWNTRILTCFQLVFLAFSLFVTLIYLSLFVTLSSFDGQGTDRLRSLCCEPSQLFLIRGEKNPVYCGKKNDRVNILIMLTNLINLMMYFELELTWSNFSRVTAKVNQTRKCENCNALQCEGGPTSRRSRQSFWAVLTNLYFTCAVIVILEPFCQNVDNNIIFSYPNFFKREQ